MKKTYSYDPTIYKSESILQAIEDFSETCIIEKPSDWQLVFELEDDDDTLFYEFMNYVISL